MFWIKQMTCLFEGCGNPVGESSKPFTLLAPD